LSTEELALGWPCPTADQMRAIDRDAIEKRGIPARLLMENAGRAVAQAIRRRYPHVERPLVLCGSGNNGGDGLVVARALHESDSRIEPCVVTYGSAQNRSRETAANLELWLQGRGPVVHAPSGERLRELLGAADLVVDALFGVGLSRPIEGEIADAIAAANEALAPRVAIDVPSGLCSDSGRTLGARMEADLIVTLGLPKLGLALRPLPDCALWIADIGFPRDSRDAIRVPQWWLTPDAVARRLPERPIDGHKGTFGHVLIVAGSEGKTGAAALSARGALRAGAGLVTVATPRATQPILAMQLLEAMTFPLRDVGEGIVKEGVVPELLAQLATRDVLVIGPGLGTAATTALCVRHLLAQTDRPAVVDADALNSFEGDPESLRGPGPRILTPHPGEAARLLRCSVPELQDQRADAARTLAARSEAFVVLKGARSLIAAPDGRLVINPTGGPGLASGGSGDVLSGVLGALIAQGLDAFDAAVVGTYLHGRAGELRSVGLLAHEVADRIPRVWQELLRSSESARDGGPLVPLHGS